MRIRIAQVLLVFVVATAMSGCGLFRKNVDYTGSKEGRPLEIPPDLDAPSTAGALTIPSPGTGPVRDANVPSEAPADAAPIASSTPSSSEPPSPVVAGEDSTLHLTDGVAGAWRRVGLALSRAGVGEVVANDEAAGTYTVAGVTQATAPPEGGFIKRMFKRDQRTSVEATRVVRIVADGDGSEVRIENEQGEASSDEFARRIIAALKQRLG